MKFNEPNLFEFILYDLENFKIKSFREKLVALSYFSNQKLDENTSFAQVEEMINDFERLLKGELNVVQFRR
jgi:hypothetical protein